MKSHLSALCAALLLAGCATAPTGPSVMALPGTGKTFEQFRFDDGDCRQYASSQTGGAQQAGNDASVRNAAVGTAIGAVAGAAIGGRQGAAVGAGGGLIVGSTSGAGAADRATYHGQRDYDHAYIQCMYAKGHKVPVAESAWRSQVVQQPAAAAPPPPPGPPPPPPPR